MLKELRNQHRTIIQMLFNGYKNHEIAERLEMTQSTVSQIVRSPLGQAYLEGLQDKAQEATLDVRKKLVSMNRQALSTIERILNPAEKAPHTVQLTAAKDVLDRTGYKAPDRLHIDMTMQTKTDQEIEAEISSLQQSINKTYLQSPGASTKALTSQDNKMDSSDQPIIDIPNVVDYVDESDDSSPSESLTDNSPSSLSEESIFSFHDILADEDCYEDPSEIASLPHNIFQQST